MTESAEMIRVALLALLAGVALPLLIQLFLAARSLRRSAEAVERRLDQTLREVSDLAADLRRHTTASPASSLGALVAAATPAVIAAVRAFRGSMQESHADPVAANHHEKEKNP